MELADKPEWFWDAALEEHGTMTGDFSQPSYKLTKAHIKGNLDTAQYTRVSVLPKAVAAAHRHMMQK